MSTALSNRKLVCVVWDDAHGCGAGEYSEADVIRDFHKAITFYSYGLLIQHDAAGITIVSEETEDEDLRGITFIPAGMILEVVDMGIPRRRSAARATKTAPPPPPPPQ